MLYEIAHIIRARAPYLWRIAECINTRLFLVRYGNRLNKVAFHDIPTEYDLMPINSVETDRLVEFFKRQPVEAFTYFRPHQFDEKSLLRLQKNRSFLGYVLFDKASEKIAGYCFNRCYFNGKGFRGMMVGIDYRGRGLATKMHKLLNEVGFGIGLRLFESISRDNIPSYRSALSANKVKVVKELDNNEALLEIMPD